MYSYLPKGVKIINDLKKRVSSSLEGVGALEVFLPLIQNKTMWQQSSRLDSYGSEMFIDDTGKYILAPTSEEAATITAKSMVKSYRDLPLMIYQSDRKFRNEIRPRFGTIRTKEFFMTEAYSFASNEEGMKSQYDTAKKSILLLLQDLGLSTSIRTVEANEITTLLSEEIVVDTVFGEVEVAHVFQLGDRYSRAFNFRVHTKENTHEYVQMGCYGIGLSRLLTVLLSQKNEE